MQGQGQQVEVQVLDGGVQSEALKRSFCQSPGLKERSQSEQTYLRADGGAVGGGDPLQDLPHQSPRALHCLPEGGRGAGSCRDCGREQEAAQQDQSWGVRVSASGQRVPPPNPLPRWTPTCGAVHVCQGGARVRVRAAPQLLVRLPSGPDCCFYRRPPRARACPRGFPVRPSHDKNPELRSSSASRRRAHTEPAR